MDQSKKEKMNQINHEWRQIERQYEQFFKSLGLSTISFSILENLYESEESYTQKLLCEKYNLPKQTVNLVIKSFWEQGYVTLEESKNDRRNKEITLTEAGKDYAKNIIQKWDDIEAEVFESSSLEEMDAMLQYLIKWQAAFQEKI